MFSLVTTVQKLLIRNFTRATTRVDPGINRRKKVLELNEELEDDLEDPESDFMGVHKTHREHINEINYMLEKEKYHIIRQKYFKEKYPNFLTWNDKEQIRYLHSTNPEEWTIENLAEGFPALPHVIKKIIKSKWTKNSTKIKKHDLAVQKNWEMFKTGQIPELPDDLVQHLNKFTNRALNLKPFEVPQTRRVIEMRKPKNTEFSDIINSYEKLKNKNFKEEPQVITATLPRPADSTDTYLMVDKREFKDKRHLTLQELQIKIERKGNRGTDLTSDDKLVIKGLQEYSKNKEVEVNEKIVDLTKNKYESSGGSLVPKSERDYSHLVYPEYITIPKNIKRQGYTYKLNDCYYDDDGWFLYRVPGMG